MQTKDAPNTLGLLRKVENKKPEEVNRTATAYLAHFDKDNDKTENKEKSALTMTDRFYNLVTDFYEWGWGESFHFARFQKGDTKKEAFARHEFFLALKMKMEAGDEVLDCGCGIGGPARAIAQFAEVKVTGININEYQIQRARALTEKRNLQDQVTFRKENFNEMSFEDETFDKAYAIEATCHAVDVRKAYSEIFRVLKPGAIFGCYEWCMTGKYDPSNNKHQKLKHDIIVGNGLPDVRTIPEVKAALNDVGFHMIESRDVSLESPIPWYEVFSPNSEFSVSTPTQRYMTHLTLSGLEMVKMVPKGSVTVHKTLCQAADGLYAAAKGGIFTPMFFFLVQKPLE